MQYEQNNKCSNQQIIDHGLPTKVITQYSYILKLLKKSRNEKPQPFKNLKGKRTALQELSERDEIVIEKAGEGGAVVKIDAEDYIREAESRLKSKDNCMIQLKQ